LEIELNFQQNPQNISHLILTLVPHYLEIIYKNNLSQNGADCDPSAEYIKQVTMTRSLAVAEVLTNWENSSQPSGTTCNSRLLLTRQLISGASG